MRMKLATFLVLGASVAGCASNPPPPPPMAMAPEPAPMAAPERAPARRVATMMFKGTVEAAAENGPRCRKMGPDATARVSGRSAIIGGTRAVVGTDGALSGGRRGPSVTGTMANNTIDATTKVGQCSYHYMLNAA